jgi:membrane-bound metal-dependent hydrolase YbcI (DUF457 family)
MAVVPDLDFIPGIIQGQPNLYHQGVSHSMGIAFVVSFGLAAVYGMRQGTVKSDAVLFSLAYLSHLFLDFFGTDTRPPIGEPIFWPVDGSYYLAPVPVFWGVHHAAATSARTGEWLVAILHPQNIGAVLFEILVMLPVIFWIRHVKNRNVKL